MKTPDELYRALEIHRVESKGYVDMQRLLIKYGMESFLRRLEKSSFADDFVLKGAMSFPTYLDQCRSTRDADFQVYGLNDAKSLIRAFGLICSPLPYRSPFMGTRKR
jgi:hypothetical protein